MVWDTIDRRKGEDEDMQWLDERSHRMDEAKFRSYYKIDTF
jgi:hypothetical protein